MRRGILYPGLVYFVTLTQALIWDQIKSLLYPGVHCTYLHELMIKFVIKCSAVKKKKKKKGKKKTYIFTPPSAHCNMVNF